MSDKEVKAVAVRMGIRLSNELDALINESGMAYNKQEFTLFALKRTFMYILNEFNITPDGRECDYVAISKVLNMMSACKREFDSSKEDLQQYIIRMPMGLYERMSEMCRVLDLSTQDFIKGSVIREMRHLERFNQEYALWFDTVDRISHDDFQRSVIRASFLE